MLIYFKISLSEFEFSFLLSISSEISLISLISTLKNLESKPTLFYEFHGSETSNKESIDIAQLIKEHL